MAEDLGARLLAAKIVSFEELESAVRDAPEGGVELVTELVRQGLAEDRLAQFFAGEGYGTPFTERDLSRADPELARRIPGKLAIELLALPFKSVGGSVEVAMVDPSDGVARTKLAEALGAPVMARVAPLSLLRRSVERTWRRLVRDPGGDADSGRLPFDGETGPIDLVASQPVPLVRPKVHSTSPPRASQGPAAARFLTEPGTASYRTLPPDGSDYLAAIDRGQDRDQVLRMACEAAAAMAGGAAFLSVRGYPDATTVDLRATAGSADPARLPDLSALVRPSGSLGRVLDLGRPYCGPYVDTEADRGLSALLGGEARSVVLEPVRLGDRLVAVLCVDDIRFGQEGVDRASSVARAVERALTRIVAAKKADT